MCSIATGERVLETLIFIRHSIIGEGSQDDTLQVSSPVRSQTFGRLISGEALWKEEGHPLLSSQRVRPATWKRD
jgi:hypothetical protein